MSLEYETARSTKPNTHRLGLHWRILIGLLVGSVAGILCNLLLRNESGEIPEQLRQIVRTVVNPIGQIFLRLI